MIVKNPQFEISAVSPKQYPKNDLPEYNSTKQMIQILNKFAYKIIYRKSVV